MNNTRFEWNGLAAALGATVMWSTSGILIDRIDTTYHLTALEISVWRVTLILPFLLVWVVVSRADLSRVRLSDLPLFLAAGLIGVTVSNLTWAESVRLNQPAAASAISFTAPALIALGDRILFHTRLVPAQWALIVLNLAGSALASGILSFSQIGHSPAGLLVGLGNALAFTAYTLMSRHAGRAAYAGNVLLLAFFLIGGAGLLAGGLAAEGTHVLHPTADAGAWITLLALGIGPTLLAYALFNQSLRRLPATIAGLITTLEPPLVAAGALVFLGRPVSERQWFGIALIVGAVTLMQIIAMRPVQAPASDEPVTAAAEST